ncbi:MAG: AmmeMemoRadiSam system radical SAM enzyme [Geopsychrobacter sp.]|nr:AmmeMemoRadiSam system radical SAM enzyme [Geopsychrobacter sp.]
MKEALLYEKLGDNRVRCQLCPYNCVISAGQTGYCGVRKNIEGRLFALTYGKVISIAVDPIEKKPLHHFYPGASALSIGTFGCNLRCQHCQNWQISHQDATVEDEHLQDLPSEQVIAMARRRDCEVIAYTYNEPSIWFEYLLDTARLAKQAGIFNVMVTAGMINPTALKSLLNYVDVYRLDIKGFSEELYQRLTGRKLLAQVLENARIAFKAGAHLEIVTNIIPNWNDSQAQLDGLSRWIVHNLGPDIPWHVTRYHPAYKLTEPATPVETLNRAREIGFKNGLRYIYVGNVPGHPGQNTLCPGCGKTLIDRTGFVIGNNHILKGCCEFCGHKIGHYCGSDTPPRQRSTPSAYPIN